MTTISAASLKGMTIDDVVSLIRSSHYSFTQNIVDALLELDNIITSYDDLVKIISCYSINDDQKIKILEKYSKYCDNVENIVTLLERFHFCERRVDFVRICKNKIKKFSDLQKILFTIKNDYPKFKVIKMFDFLGITYPDISKLLNMFDAYIYQKLVIVYFKNHIDEDTIIKLINKHYVGDIYNLFRINNFDKFVDIFTKLDSYEYRKQLILHYEKLFDGQNIFKYLELLDDFSEQFHLIKLIYKELSIENPLELLKCVNGVTRRDDENRKQLLEFIVKKMNVVLDTRCLNYFVTEEVRIELISNLVRSGAIKI